MNKLQEIKERYRDDQKWAADPEDVRYLLQLVETQRTALEEAQHHLNRKLYLTAEDVIKKAIEALGTL